MASSHDPVVNLLGELAEEPVLQGPVVGEARDRGGGGELGVELGGVPHLQVGSILEVEHRTDDEHDQAADQAMEQRAARVLQGAESESYHWLARSSCLACLISRALRSTSASCSEIRFGVRARGERLLRRSQFYGIYHPTPQGRR
jgi:hypothetical protein